MEDLKLPREPEHEVCLSLLQHEEIFIYFISLLRGGMIY